MHGDVCWHAQSKEPNKKVHILLRLADIRMREQLKGSLGASMLILEVAEVIRRAAESALNIELPEEGDQGASPRDLENKRENYGSTRLFDDDAKLPENLFVV
jgi:hypothetical protein